MTETQENVRRHVEELAGTIGERNVFRPEALSAAVVYIETVWQNQDYAVIRQEYETNGVRCANLEVTVPGASRSGEILLLGAHYDTVPGSPGANDNGSGVAALLEIARLFAGRLPALTVRFVAFVNEAPCTFQTDPRRVRLSSVDWANLPVATNRPLCREHLGGTCAPAGGRDGCPVGSLRRRAPVQGSASIAAARPQEGS